MFCCPSFLAQNNPSVDEEGEDDIPVRPTLNLTITLFGQNDNLLDIGLIYDGCTGIDVGRHDPVSKK